jgi:HD-GYP domain-containing protein (c-di-GMP phosphodiesterase class II)
MKKFPINTNIEYEEKRTLKWFLILFYVIYIGFDLVFDIISKFVPKLGSNKDFFGVWMYVIVLALIPIAYYLNKRQKHHLIKYVYFISFTFLTLLNEIGTYIHNPDLYKGGNAVEIFWLLLSPIFVSMPFLKIVSGSLVLKYIIVGVIIQSPNAIIGILLVGIFSVFSFILLNRFKSYVNVIKSSYDQQLVGIVKGVIATLELKDPYTKGHSERVALYSQVIAKEINIFTKEELKTFYYACLLHDIGKVNIPDHILTKSSSLTYEEYEIIKTHPSVGAEAILKVEGFKNCLDVIKYHHERWDGKGYPDQLKGEDIPYLARVAAIADAFDAMTSTRSYRSALSIEEAYNRVLEGKGTQFDPVLVNLFQEMLPQLKQIHNNLNEIEIHQDKAMM